MINFSESTSADVKQITEWTARDLYHTEEYPEWWLTGNGLLAFCLMDERGPLAYVRLNAEGEYVRIHTQFAPESIVSKRRLVVGMIECVRKLIEIYKADEKKGLIFGSISPTLVAFMDKHLGFKPVGISDHRLDFERE